VLPRRTPAIALTLAFVLAALLVAGCGSSKPSYCSKADNLELAVQGLGEIDLSKGISAVTSAVSNVQTSASAAVTAARKDFPTETGRIDSSVTTLKTAVDTLPSSPSASQIATLALDIKSVVDAVTGFVDQTKKKCG
jgi:outer membrane murein-binding lipoprotein Lpp